MFSVRKHVSAYKLYQCCNFLDLSKPHQWFEEARQLKRQIICHVGPTNSGKTHSAIEALSKSKSGIYCGPLRLFAVEIAEKLRSLDVKCSLLTGNERENIEASTHVACTVEMANLHCQYDTAVVDEAQLIGDISRGWAWTHAILGLKAEVVHVCGSSTLLPIIEDICKKTGDSMSIIEYSRLSPLTVSGSAVEYWEDIRSGDCVIGFSRKSLFDIRRKIERACPQLRCSVIYGSLPPSARREQARLFSCSDNNFNVLVASDAVGMGLNLSIGRIIFTTLEKYDGQRDRLLHSSEMKQIAGRAGRFNSAFGLGVGGEATCVTAEDLQLLSKGMQAQDKPVRRAGLFPTMHQLQMLGVMTDLQLEEDDLQRFLARRAAAEWGVDTNNNYDDDDDDVSDLSFIKITTAAILRQFGSVEVFVKDLEEYLLDKYGRLAELRCHRGKSNSDHRHRRPNSTAKQAQARFPDGVYSPHTSLCELLSSFQHHCDMDGGLYFLCNLEEQVQLARVIDKVSLNFRDRYVFCTAPVSSDSRHVCLAMFKSYVAQYSACRRGLVSTVRVNVTMRRGAGAVPRDQSELLRLETDYHVLELYVWLALRFPAEFQELEYAQQQLLLCVSLINKGLLADKLVSSHAPREAIKYKKRRTKKSNFDANENHLKY